MSFGFHRLPATLQSLSCIEAVTIDRGAKQIVGAGTATATEPTREHKQYAVLKLREVGRAKMPCILISEKVRKHYASTAGRTPQFSFL